MTRRLAAAVGAIVLAMAGVPASSREDLCGAPCPPLIAEGERLWTRSPAPGNPVACATCHHDPAATRGWAASFPKWKPLPPPHARVMTLLQANAEAVARHYRPANPLPAAVAITAYLEMQGAAMPLSPGIAAGQPVFPERLQALAASVARGTRWFDRRCARCHDADTAAALALGFPRRAAGRAESLELFLESHPRRSGRLPWDADRMADLVAHVVSRRVPRLTVLAPPEGSR